MSAVGSLVIFYAFLTFEIFHHVVGARGYNYPKPEPPPIHFDEPSTPSGIYLPPIPPIFQEEELPPQLPPIPIPTYLPSNVYPPLAIPPEIFNDEDTVVIPSSPPTSLYQTPVPRMRVLNMSCILNTSFRSTLRMEGRSSSQPPPVIDDGSEGCITASTSGTFVINMEGSKRMTDCGVRTCTSGVNSRTNMCVTVRMPTIQGLKLPEDNLMTLQCTPQDSVVSHTKNLRLGPTTITKARSNNGIVATGGGQPNFESRMVLLRRSSGSNSFDQPLQSGSVVPLGEEIVLRATVQDGDGWQYSRMGPVIVRSSNSRRSLTLVEENGCRSPGIRSICPFQPRQLTPLDNILQFRAFLFQDSARGDDMVLSVRMLGCLNAQDCFLAGVCDDSNISSRLRSKRDAKNKNETSWESQIEFRVQMPAQNNQNNNIKEPFNFSSEYLIIVSLFGLCVFLVLGLFIVYFKKKY